MRATALFLLPLSSGVAEASHTARRAQAKRKGWRSSFRGHNRQPTSSRGIILMVSLSLPEITRWDNLSSRRVYPSPIFQRLVQCDVPVSSRFLGRPQLLTRHVSLPLGRDPMCSPITVERRGKEMSCKRIHHRCPQHKRGSFVASAK
jgi:hypothetical protein